MKMSYRIGIDVGGTFTDFLLVDEEGGTEIYKVTSTPADPSLGTMGGLEEMASSQGSTLADFLSRVSLIVHGTTITTNMVKMCMGVNNLFYVFQGFVNSFKNHP